jgi:hypothetical protein
MSVVNILTLAWPSATASVSSLRISGGILPYNMRWKP